jgi:hypothetical protein
MLETMAYQRPIIQLKPDCQPSDFIMVKLQQTYANNRVEKLETPATERSSIEQILYCGREFLETASQLNFDTGPQQDGRKLCDKSKRNRLKIELVFSMPCYLKLQTD